MMNTANKVYPEKKNKMKPSYLEVALMQPTKSYHSNSASPVVLESTRVACISHNCKDTQKLEKYIKKSDAVVFSPREPNKVRK